MKLKWIMIAILSGAAVGAALGIAACAPSSGSGASRASDMLAQVTDDDMETAYYQLMSQGADGTSITYFTISGDSSEKTIRATFDTIGEDGQQGAITKEAEMLLRRYSLECAKAALARVQEANADGEASEEDVQAWQSAVDSEQAAYDAAVAALDSGASASSDEGSAIGAGALYDTYKVIAVIQSENGLLIDGEREPDSGTYNWQ